MVSVRIGQKMGFIFLQESADKPKIVDALLGEEVVDVACGWNHVVVLTSDAENPIFTWGIDTNGCLGKLDCLKLLEGALQESPDIERLFNLPPPPLPPMWSY